MNKPSVLIGVPTLNGSERLRRCLVSIEECTDFAAFGNVKLVVRDDGSTEEYLKRNTDVVRNRVKLHAQAGLELVLNGQRCGISKTWNKLVRHQPADVVVLLNDDFEVVDRWLDVLVYSLRENPKVGMVGLNAYVALIKSQWKQLFPKTVYDGTETGRETLWHELSPMLDYREAKLLDGGGSLLSAQGPAFAFRRADFDAVGGFDERYFVFYEELDFAISLRGIGLYPFMASYPIGYHQGGATNSDPFNLNASEHIASSRKVFLEKWGKTPAELREEFLASYVRPVLREWTSQVANWK